MKKQKKELSSTEYNLKYQLKVLAEIIKNKKKIVAGWQRLLTKYPSSFGQDAAKKTVKKCYFEIKQTRVLYRHMHIAYSELLGNSRLRIEPKTMSSEKISEEMVQNFKK